MTIPNTRLHEFHPEPTMLKPLPALVLVAVVSAGCPLPGIAQEKATPRLDIAAKELGWQEFTPPDKSFKLMFPAKPAKQRISEVNRSSGIDLSSYKATLGTLEFTLMYLTLSYPLEDAETSKRLLDGARELALANTKAQVLSEIEMWFDEHPGRELLVKFPTTIMKARIFLIARRMYTLGVTLPYTESNQKEIKDAVELMANRYFASFTRLVPKK